MSRLQAFFMCGALQLPNKPLGVWIVRVYEQADHSGLGNQFGNEFDPLLHQLREHHADASEVAARPGEAGHQARRHRVAAAEEDDRDCRGRILRCKRRSIAGYHDEGDVVSDNVGSQ